MLLNIHEFSQLIRSNQKLGFYSTSASLYPIKVDISLSCHPHDNKNRILSELTSKYRYVTTVYMNGNNVTDIGTSASFIAGFVFSNHTIKL